MTTIRKYKKRMPIILKPEDEIKWLENYSITVYDFPYQVHLEAKNISENGSLV